MSRVSIVGAWHPDRDHPLAQNASQVTKSLQQLATHLEPLLARGDLTLVLGGNCTIVLGVMAALRHLGAGVPGLLYLDRHYDLNTPETTTDGVLDWMGSRTRWPFLAAWTPSPRRLAPGRCLSPPRWHGSGWSRPARPSHRRRRPRLHRRPAGGKYRLP